MSRLFYRLAIALPALVAAAPALAADFSDYSGSLRPSYDDWQQVQAPQPLGFEFGLRYWYSWGEDRWSLAGDDYNSNDKSQFGELHLRIDDYETNSYVKGLAGYSAAISGDTDTPFGSDSISDGHIGYAGADFGWSPFGGAGGGSGIYGLVGYQYWNESPNMGRASYTTATSAGDVDWPFGAGAPGLPGDSEPNNIDIHALRLGVSGKAQINPFFDVSAEVAAVPYAWVNGTFGAFDTPVVSTPASYSMQGSAADVNGFGYGAMGEVMLGFHPTENMAIHIGGRAWYLQGRVDSTFTRTTVSAPTDPDDEPGVSRQDYISTSNPFSLFRYGLLGELTYKF